MTDPAVTKAIEAAGNATKLARALGITRAAVCQWKKIPPKRLADVARLTGLPAAELRPDLANVFAGGADLS